MLRNLLHNEVNIYYMLLHNALLQGFKGALGDKMKKKKYV